MAPLGHSILKPKVGRTSQTYLAQRPIINASSTASCENSGSVNSESF